MKRIAVLASCLLFAACSSSVDLSELEERLVSEQEAKAPDLEVGEATCPDDVEIEEGATFECTVDVEGVDAPYEVTMSDVDEEAENAHFDFKPAKPIIDVSKVVAFLRSQLNPGIADVDIDCGSEAVIVSEVGGTIECTVSDEQDSETVSLVVKDLEGTIAFE